MVYYYSVIVVLVICLLTFLAMVLQRRREQERQRRKLELISAQRRLEESRERLGILRKSFYEAENKLIENKHFHKTRREELIQIAKQLNEVEQERDALQRKLDDGAAPTDQDANLLENRLKLIRERHAQLAVEVGELQEKITFLEQSSRENEREISNLQLRITETENELEYNREQVKLKERLVRG